MKTAKLRLFGITTASLFLFLLFQNTSSPSTALLNTSPSSPSWLDQNRSLAHTGVGPSYASATDRPNSTHALTVQRRQAFYNATAEMNLLGATAYVRHVKTNWQGTLYPSAVPVLQNTNDYVSRFMETNLSGTKIIAYYWDGGEGRTSSDEANSYLQQIDSSTYTWTMPDEWLCKDLDGNFIANGLSADLTSVNADSTARGYHVDLSQPEYRMLVLNRLKEMVNKGISGFYFDERHFPAHRIGTTRQLCFGSRTQQLYLQRSGATLPTGPSDPAFQKYAVFQGKQLTQFIKYLRVGLKNAFPDREIPIIFSGTYIAGFTLPHMSLTQARESDSVKVEYLNGVRDLTNDFVFQNQSLLKPPKDVRLAFGLTIARDAADGRPPTVWAPDHMTDLSQIKAYSHSILAYGGVVQLYVTDSYLAGPPYVLPATTTTDTEATPVTPYNVLKSGMQYLNSQIPTYSFARPYKYAAVHLSERMRNRLYASVGNASNEATELAWKEVIWPSIAAYGAFIRLGLPVNIITDEQILDGQLNDYTVLYTLSQPIANGIKTAIDVFSKQSGKKVFYDNKSCDPSCIWQKDAAQSEEIQAEDRITGKINFIASSLPAQIPVQVVFPYSLLDSSRKPQATFQKNPASQNEIILTILNDFSWLVQNDGKKFPNPTGVEPDPLNGVRVYLAAQPSQVVDTFSGNLMTVRSHDGRFYFNSYPVAVARVYKIKY